MSGKKFSGLAAAFAVVMLVSALALSGCWSAGSAVRSGVRAGVSQGVSNGVSQGSGLFGF